jgi:hypothetical protein
MRFESLMWTVLAMLLAGSAAWDQADSTQPLQTDERLEAKDGGGKVPPE